LEIFTVFANSHEKKSFSNDDMKLSEDRLSKNKKLSDDSIKKLQ